MEEDLQKKVADLQRRLEKMERMFHITPTLNVIGGQTYIRGWVNIDGSIIYSGTGAPGGVVVANQGSLYLRRDGGTSTTLYVKTSGNGTASGWTAK